MAKVVDIKRHGIDETLAPFVKDINLLATEGVTVECRGVKMVLRGSLLEFLANNLGSHCVGWFKESFSFAFRFCRTCLATPEQSQDHFTASVFEARTPEIHKRQASGTIS